MLDAFVKQQVLAPDWVMFWKRWYFFEMTTLEGEAPERNTIQPNGWLENGPATFNWTLS
jgi:hypothetical protein